MSPALFLPILLCSILVHGCSRRKTVNAKEAVVDESDKEVDNTTQSVGGDMVSGGWHFNLVDLHLGVKSTTLSTVICISFIIFSMVALCLCAWKMCRCFNFFPRQPPPADLPPIHFQQLQQQMQLLQLQQQQQLAIPMLPPQQAAVPIVNVPALEAPQAATLRRSPTTTINPRRRKNNNILC